MCLRNSTGPRAQSSNCGVPSCCIAISRRQTSSSKDASRCDECRASVGKVILSNQPHSIAFYSSHHQGLPVKYAAVPFGSTFSKQEIACIATYQVRQREKKTISVQFITPRWAFFGIFGFGSFDGQFALPATLPRRNTSDANLSSLFSKQPLTQVQFDVWSTAPKYVAAKKLLDQCHSPTEVLQTSYLMTWFGSAIFAQELLRRPFWENHCLRDRLFNLK